MPCLILRRGETPTETQHGTQRGTLRLSAAVSFDYPRHRSCRVLRRPRSARYLTEVLAVQARELVEECLHLGAIRSEVTARQIVYCRTAARARRSGLIFNQSCEGALPLWGRTPLDPKKEQAEDEK